MDTLLHLVENNSLKQLQVFVRDEKNVGVIADALSTKLTCEKSILVAALILDTKEAKCVKVAKCISDAIVTLLKRLQHSGGSISTSNRDGAIDFVVACISHVQLFNYMDAKKAIVSAALTFSCPLCFTVLNACPPKVLPSLLALWLQELDEEDIDISVLELVSDVINVNNSGFSSQIAARSACLMSIIQYAIEANNPAILALWKALDLFVGTTPRSVAQKKVGVILSYAGLRFKLKTMSHMSLDNQEPAVEGSPLQPLILISAGDKEFSVRALASQYLVDLLMDRAVIISAKNAHWAIALNLVVNLANELGGCCILANATKSVQNRILTQIRRIIEFNPFQRSFPHTMSYRECTQMIQNEIESSKISRPDGESVRDFVLSENNLLIWLNLALRQEIQFVECFTKTVLPSVIDLLRQSAYRTLAPRTISWILDLLQSTVVGCSSTVLLTSPNIQLVIRLGNLVSCESFRLDALAEVSFLNCHLSTNLMRVFAKGSFLDLATSTIQECQATGRDIHLSLGWRHLMLWWSMANTVEGCTTSNVMLRIHTENESALLEYISNDAEQITEDDSASYVIYTPLIGIAIMGLSKQAANDANVLDTILTYFEQAAQDEINSLELSLWLLMIANILPENVTKGKVDLTRLPQRERIISLLFPTYLTVNSIMPIAIHLAVRLSEPEQLLFECIGYLQDAAFDDKTTTTHDLSQYIRLIGVVADEVTKLIRLRWKSHSNIIGFDQGTSELHQGKLNSTNGKDELDEEYFSQDLANALINLKDIDDLVDDQPGDLREALEAAVYGENSFLYCFVPMLAEVVNCPEMDVTCRQEAVRCLGKFSSCSRSILTSILPVFENWFSEYSFNGLQCNLLIEALAVWTENYDPTLSSMDCILTFLLAVWKDLTMAEENCTNSGLNTTSKQSTRIFTGIMNALFQLTAHQRYRHPVIPLAMIGLPIAFGIEDAKSSNSEEIRDACIERVSFLLRRFTTEINRLVFWLCRVPTKHPSADSVAMVPMNIADRLADIFTSSMRINLIKSLLSIATNLDEGIAETTVDDSLDADEHDPQILNMNSKVFEIEIALTKEVISFGNSFATSILEFIPTSTASKQLISSAIETGAIQNLPDNVKAILQRRAKAGANAANSLGGRGAHLQDSTPIARRQSKIGKR